MDATLKPKPGLLILILITILGAFLTYLLSNLKPSFFDLLESILSYKSLVTLTCIILVLLIILVLAFVFYLPSNIFSFHRLKKKYTLKEISSQYKVYVPKKKDCISDTHWLCTNCMDIHHKESLYLPKNDGSRCQYYYYYCPNCPSEIKIMNKDYRDPFSDISLNDKYPFH